MVTAVQEVLSVRKAELDEIDDEIAFAKEELGEAESKVSELEDDLEYLRRKRDALVRGCKFEDVSKYILPSFLRGFELRVISGKSPRKKTLQLQLFDLEPEEKFAAVVLGFPDGLGSKQWDIRDFSLTDILEFRP